MITDTKEIAERLRTETDCRRDCNGDDTLFDICTFTSYSMSLQISSISNRVKVFSKRFQFIEISMR